MEDTVTQNTKVSDSGYSNSCSNSQSQRSGSSKSRHSGSSSGSSGYCGHPSTNGSSNDSFQHPSATKQRKEYKKKKMKGMTSSGCNSDLLNSDAVDGSGGGGTITVATTQMSNSSLETLKPAETASIVPMNLDATASLSQNVEKETAQLNPLTHPSLSIGCIKKLKGKDCTINQGEKSGELPLVSSENNVDTTNDDDDKVVVESISKTAVFKDEFSAVVSMKEGVILYTTTSLTDVLGYPKDMWLGRSLIDFVHPKDRKTFNNHVTTGIANPHIDRRSNNLSGQSASSSNKKNTLYCCLRQYRGLKSIGFGILDRKVSYLPCQLTLAFREISTKTSVSDAIGDENECEHVASDNNVLRAILLVITAKLVRSSYKMPDEVCASSTYMTRHSTSMAFTHVDTKVVTYFGYLPQDMVGKSVFNFYHPEDLPYLREIYINVFKDKGQRFRSKPYRFRTQNGCFAMVETEWSSFVNPWTKKIEFVSGQHRVIKGPSNPDVITPVEPEPLQISEEVLKESNSIQEEISKLLNESADSLDSTKYQMSKYCKELLKFIENYIDEGKKMLPSDKCETRPMSLSISDRDSAMLGEISPHHEYYDSKSSSETPPSYTQLNYNDNIQRFFESKPKTTLSDESSGSKVSLCNENARQSSNGEDEGKISPAVDSSCTGSQNSGLINNNESGGSSDLSSASGAGEANLNKNTKYRTPHLTEALLCKHNENMEKRMVQLHRERSKSDREHKFKDGNRHKKYYDKILDDKNSHGVKRSGSHSWEGEPYKSVKQTHATNINQQPTASVSGALPNNCSEVPPSGFSSTNGPTGNINNSSHPKPIMTSPSSVNLWPPFSVSVTPMNSTPPCPTHLNYSAANLTGNNHTMMPMYYIHPACTNEVANPEMAPTSLACGMDTTTSRIQPPPQPPPYIAGQFQYMTSMMYHPIATAMPMFGIPPTVMYSPLTMLPAPLLPSQPMKPAGHHSVNSTPLSASHLQPQQQNDNNQKNHSVQMKYLARKNNGAQRPASQATSVKAEPGSALCSVASNSLKQALSEVSIREGKSMYSASPNSVSSQNDLDNEKRKEDDVNSNELLGTGLNNDNSSFYSSFYSYMKTDEKSDESMKSLTENESCVDMRTDNKLQNTNRKIIDYSNSKSTSFDHMRREFRKVPPWLENVSLTHDLIFRYQVGEKELSDVLEADLKMLADINQPLMVNDQLCQLYLDIENFHQQDCNLETSVGTMSSSGTSSGEPEESSPQIKTKKKYRTMEYHDRMVMLFEENAPMPPPVAPLPTSIASQSLLPVSIES